MRPIEAMWARVPGRMLTLDLSGADWRVYAYIEIRCGRRRWWYGTQTEIAEGTGVVPRTVRTAIRRLEDDGLIEVARQGAERATVLLYSIPADLTTVEESITEERASGRIDPLGPPPDSGSNDPTLQRPSGSNDPTERHDRSAPTTSDPYAIPHESESDASGTDDPLSGPSLTYPQRQLLHVLHGEVGEKLCGGAGWPDAQWCDDLVARGMTMGDVNAAVQAALARGIHYRRATAYVRAVIEGRVKEREDGHDPDESRAGGGNGRGVRDGGGTGRAAPIGGARRRDGRGGGATPYVPTRKSDI